MRITWSEAETGGRKGMVFISMRFRAQSDCLNNQFEYWGIKVKIQFDHYTQIWTLVSCDADQIAWSIFQFILKCMQSYVYNSNVDMLPGWQEFRVFQL